MRAVGWVTVSLVMVVLLSACDGDKHPAVRNDAAITDGLPDDGSSDEDGSSCVPSTEDSQAACTDSVDNDCDGLVDCHETACATFCPAENSNARCNNGTDDDMDGVIDCADSDCAARIVCAGEVTNAACSDGVDNNGVDGVDCADPACRDEAIVVCNGTTPVTVASSQWPAMISTRCTNAASDDADAFRDCAENSCLWNYASCVVPPREATNATCSDSTDNDLDGVVDCNDTGCQQEGIAVCSGSTPVTVQMAQWQTMSELECSNGDDDDSDSFIDCDDPGCSQNPDVLSCPNAENTNALCGDGVSNDGDNLVDCADPSCTTNPYVTVCDNAVENTYAECSNGLDDDTDGLRDCADTSACTPLFGAPSPACL